MLNKAISSIVLATAALVSGQAMALQDAGFESATSVSSWTPTIGGTVERRSAGPVTIYDDTYGDITTSYSVNPVSGSSYGMLVGDYTTSATSMYTFNLSGAPTVAGDKFYVRLFSAEYDLVNHNDNFTVTFNNNAGAPVVFNWSVADTYQYVYGGANPALQLSPDSGWLEVSSMPVGTNSIYFQINNVSTDGGNMPLVAVDFAPAAVPEADVTAMMLAGFGMLGLVSRRRMKKSA